MTKPMMAIAMVGLAACDEQGEFSAPFGASDEEAAPDFATAPSVSLVERDVEAPELFDVTDSGLWDGRPSLGGIWVAHPDVQDPERVIVRNQANGKSVVGALFRRERENPGPAIQVSSDAAEELGMLAGSPVQLSVIALRREEGPGDEAPDLASAPLTEPAEITAMSLDGEPIAASVDDAPVAVSAPLPDSTGPSAGSIVAALAPAPVLAPAVVDSSPAPASADTLTGAAAIAIAAAEAAAEQDALARQGGTAPVAAPVSAPASSLENPFIQIGIFSVEANAESTADKLRSDGLSTRVLRQASQGREFWRVLVGPAPNAADRDAVLQKVKSLGFPDAYSVSN